MSDLCALGCSRWCPWVPVGVSLSSCWCSCVSPTLLLLPLAPGAAPGWVSHEVLWHTLFSSCTSAVIPGGSQPSLSPQLCISLLHRACPVHLCKHSSSARGAVETQHSVFTSSSSSVCRGCPGWTEGCPGQTEGCSDHPCCPLGWALCWELHQGCFPVFPWSWGNCAGGELGLSGSPRAEGGSLQLHCGVYCKRTSAASQPLLCTGRDGNPWVQLSVPGCSCGVGLSPVPSSAGALSLVLVIS